MASLDPDRLEDARGPVAAERPLHDQRDDRDDHAAGEGHEDVAERRGDRVGGVERPGVGRPDEGLHGAEEVDEEHGPETAGDARRRDEEPEPLVRPR